MNAFTGKIMEIQTVGTFSYVQLEVEGVPFRCIVMETPATAGYLRKGRQARLLFKESDVVIARNTIENISLQNRVSCRIKTIEKGQLFSKLVLHCEIGRIVSIITSDAVRRLDLKENDEVTALVKANEIMMAE